MIQEPDILPDQEAQILLTIEQAQEKLGISKQAVVQAVGKGKIEARWVGHRCFVYAIELHRREKQQTLRKKED